MSQDLQQRAHRFELFVVAFPNGPVRIGKPGHYIDFADRAVAAAALDLLDLVSPDKRQAPRPTVAELEAILADESPAKVVVNLDGSISTVPFKEPSPELFKLLEETRKRHE